MKNPIKKHMTALYNGLEEAKEMFELSQEINGREYAINNLKETTCYKGKAFDYIIS